MPFPCVREAPGEDVRDEACEERNREQLILVSKQAEQESIEGDHQGKCPKRHLPPSDQGF